MRQRRINSVLLYAASAAVVLCLVGWIFAYYKTKEALEAQVQNVAEEFESAIGHTVNNLGLLSRLSTVQTSLFFGSPEPIEKILNQSIYQEDSIKALAVLDKSKKVFSSNTNNSSGEFSGTPTFLLTTSWSEVPVSKLMTEKYGEVEMYTLSKPPYLVFSKKVLKDDEELGTAIVSLDAASQIQALATTHEVPKYLPVQFFLTTAPQGWFCSSNKTLQELSVCGEIVSTTVFRAALGIFVLIGFTGLIVGGILFLIFALFRKEAQKEMEIKKALVELATQVSHDIRSPLSVLDSVLNADEPESKARVLQATARIREIANSLLSSYSRRISDRRIELGASILQLIEDKKLEWKRKPGVSISFDNLATEEHFIDWQSQFESVVSNLLNNSFEAMREVGNIRATLSQTENNLRLKIEDDGKGVPPDILPRLFEKGVSFGKSNGNGLGLANAKEILNAHGGTVTLASEINRGTAVVLEFPKLLSCKLKVVSSPDLVLIDNDPMVRKNWEVSAQRKHLKLATFDRPEALKKWKFQKDVPIYIDKNLDNKVSGITAAEELRIAGFSNIFLCTGESLQLELLPSFIKGVVGKSFPMKI